MPKSMRVTHYKDGGAISNEDVAEKQHIQRALPHTYYSSSAPTSDRGLGNQAL